MNKEDFLSPTKSFPRFDDITPEFLKDNGIKGVLCDIDDTLVTHNYPYPTEDVVKWINELRKADINICFVSNNGYKRVQPFAEKLGCPFFTRAQKPSSTALEQAIAVLDIKKNEAAFIGDQIFTDIKGGNLFGIHTYKVKPLGEKATLWIKLKRMRERKLKND